MTHFRNIVNIILTAVLSSKTGRIRSAAGSSAQIDHHNTAVLQKGYDMAEDERRLRFLRNWYAAHGAAGQVSVTQNLMARIRTGTRTNNGITYRYQSNGWILVNGNTTGNSSFCGYIAFRLEPGTYKKSPYVNGVGLYVQYARTSSNWIQISGISDDTPFTITPAISQYDIIARVGVRPNTAVNNVMYEPYIVRVE